ncbi:hypothetical protein EDB87DRAFT_617026 [Lactarius vividus]|nr:hypothetical protein EDB87DRAFT_617026 [Lactarius vividus]
MAPGLRGRPGAGSVVRMCNEAFGVSGLGDLFVPVASSGLKKKKKSGQWAVPRRERFEIDSLVNNTIRFHVPPLPTIFVAQSGRHVSPVRPRRPGAGRASASSRRCLLPRCGLLPTSVPPAQQGRRPTRRQRQTIGCGPATAVLASPFPASKHADRPPDSVGSSGDGLSASGTRSHGAFQGPLRCEALFALALDEVPCIPGRGGLRPALVRPLSASSSVLSASSSALSASSSALFVPSSALFVPSSTLSASSSALSASSSILFVPSSALSASSSALSASSSALFVPSSALSASSSALSASSSVLFVPSSAPSASSSALSVSSSVLSASWSARSASSSAALRSLIPISLSLLKASSKGSSKGPSRGPSQGSSKSQFNAFFSALHGPRTQERYVPHVPPLRLTPPSSGVLWCRRFKATQNGAKAAVCSMHCMLSCAAIQAANQHARAQQTRTLEPEMCGSGFPILVQGDGTALGPPSCSLPSSAVT